MNYIIKLSKECKNSMLKQINDLILMLVKKLATVAFLKTDKQYNYQVRNADSETKNLIWVLSLQIITWSKIKLAANNFKLYKKTNDFDFRKIINFNQKIMSLSIFIESESNNFDVVKNKSSILSLIKEV